MDETKMNRRSFVKGAIVVSASALGMGVLGACSPDQAGGAGAGADDGASSVSWAEETDVVIVGFGGTGASAALEATAAGAEVIVFEKGSMGGGSTAISGQAIMGVNSSVQQAMGVEDTIEDALDYFMIVGDGREELLRVVIENSGAAVDWLIDLGMEIPHEKAAPGITMGGQETRFADLTPPVERTHWSSSGIWNKLQAAVDGRGIDVRLEAPVVALVIDHDSGAVIGVAVEESGEQKLVKARRGVILAAGGYSRNPEMKNALIAKAEIASIAGMYDDGDGMNLGISAGAKVGFFGAMSSPQYYDPPTKCALLLSHGSELMEGTPPYILVNEEGVRFSDEKKFYSYIASDIIVQSGGRGFVIVGGPHGEDALYNQETQEPVILNDVKKGETVAELAVAMSIDAAVLEATIQAWNDSVAAGADSQFGRTRDLHAFTEGPYCSAEVRAGDGSTFGGVDVTTDMKAISALTNEVIPRLYAGGQSSTVLGRFYPTCGAAVATAVVSGRIAGVNAAAEEPLS